MGCGISRHELDEDDDAQSPLPKQSLPRNEEHIHPTVLKNKNHNNKDAQIYGSSSDQSQTQTQISSSMLTSIRQDPTMYVQVSTYKGNHVNKSAGDLPRLSISNKKDIGDDGQRMSNLDADDQIDPSRFSLSGSPSFREYCVVEHDCHSQDDQYIFDGNKNNIDDEERDKNAMMSKEASRSKSAVLIGKKKGGDKRRMFKKVFPLMHRPAAAAVRK